MNKNNDFIMVDGITKTFGSVVAVDNINLEIKQGEFFSLLGASGCGKTTLLRLLAGFEKPDKGRIFIEGEDITYLIPNKRPTNMVFQNYAIFPHMDVASNIGYGLRKEKLSKKELNHKIDSYLELIKLSGYGNRKADQLSGGQRQRVALARALIMQPKVLLLDEPLGALDKQLRANMQIELRSLQKDVGITFVFVTHDQVEAMTLGDRLAVINNGIIEQIGTPIEVYETPKTLFVAEFIGTPKMNFINGKIKNQKFETGKAQISLNHFTDTEEAILGFRPEDLYVDNNGIFQLNVEIIEKLGADSLIYGSDQNQNSLCLRVNGNTKINVNEKINLSLQEDKYHCFDAINKIRLI